MASTLTAAERIRAAAAERETLVQQIAATQHANATRAQLAPTIASLTNRQFEASQLYSTLATAMREQKAVLDKHQGSHVRKLFQREKHLAKLQQEEDDYIEALSWADKAQVKLGLIEKELDALKRQRDDLTKVDGEHTAALVALDELYASVFDGPSPDMPEEDALEAAVQAAQKTYDAIQMRLTHASAVVNNLSTAHAKVISALGHVGEALKFSKQDIFNSNGPHHPISAPGIMPFSSALADHRERYQLSWVQRSLAEAEHYMALAQEMDPANVGAFVRPEVADGNSTAGVLDQVMNTPITDYLFHAEIESTWGSVKQCEVLLGQEVERADARRAAIDVEKVPAEKALAEGRQRLMDFRVELFEKALRERDGKKEAEPPAYAT